MYIKISNPSDGRCITIKTNKTGECSSDQAEIKCYFEQSHILTFADFLIKCKIPAEYVSINKHNHPSGLILIQYNEDAPNTETLINDIFNAFTNFYDYEPAAIQNFELGVGGTYPSEYWSGRLLGISKQSLECN